MRKSSGIWFGFTYEVTGVTLLEGLPCLLEVTINIMNTMLPWAIMNFIFGYNAGILALLNVQFNTPFMPNDAITNIAQQITACTAFIL